MIIDEDLKTFVNHAPKDKAPLNTFWTCLLETKKHIEADRFESAVIIMGLMLEYIAFATLKNLVDKNGDFKHAVHQGIIDSVYPEGAGMAEKYYGYGLTVLGIEIDSEHLYIIKDIYDAKEALLRGEILESTDLFQFGEFKLGEEKEYFKSILVFCQDIFEIFVDYYENPDEY